MTIQQHSGSSSDDQDAFPESALRELADGLTVLWRTYNYAQDAGVDLWEFAIEIQQFYDLGLTDNELRWLVAKGLAEHALDRSTPGDARRSFTPTVGLTFSATSALVLTELGMALASQVYAAAREAEQAAAEKPPWADESSSEPAAGNGDDHLQARLTPKWDAHLRELRIGGELVKRFRVPAASQEAVLSAFEEELWPDYIDDPLPCVVNGVPKQRLHNAIKRLNDNQVNRLIHFHGDGYGEGIGWKLVVADDTNSKSKPAQRVNLHRTESHANRV